MSDFNPRNKNLLVDTDVNYNLFHCCGDEDLIIIKCPNCGVIMVQCYECETLYYDLNDLSKGMSSATDYPTPLICPWCSKPFPEFDYLMDKYVEKYLVTAKEVIEFGHPEILGIHLYNNKENS